MGGTIYSTDNRPLASIRGEYFSQEKKIYSAAGSLALKTNVIAEGNDESVRGHRYVVESQDSSEKIIACPEYAEDSEPASHGWASVPADHGEQPELCPGQ